MGDNYSNFGNAGFFDNLKAGNSELSGLDLARGQSRSFRPEMRVRVKDFFSQSAGLGHIVKDNPSYPTHLILPAVTLSKDENPDSGLIGIDINRAMGVGAASTATLQFANRDGLFYRVSGPTSDIKGPRWTTGNNARDIDAPTLEEETYITPQKDFKSKYNSQKGPDYERQVLHSRLRSYIAELARRQLLGNDISSKRRAAIRRLRASVLAGGGGTPSLNPDIEDALKTVVRVELMFDLMAQVEVDVKDARGRWFGVFTGFVSSVKDEYTAGRVPTVTLECHDKLAIFSRVLAVTARAIVPALYPTRSEKFQFNSLSYFSDQFDAKFIHEALMLLVETVNTTFSAQGYIEKADQGDLLTQTYKDIYGKGLPQFISEQYGHMGPNFIRAGLYLNNSRTVTDSESGASLVVDPDTRVQGAGFSRDIFDPLVGFGTEEEPEEVDLTLPFPTPTRFWSFSDKFIKKKAVIVQKTKGQAGKQESFDVQGKSVFSRLFRLWTFPGRVKGEYGNPKRLNPTVFKFLNGQGNQDDTYTNKSDENVAGNTFVSDQVQARLLGLPKVSYEDYRGLSPYWPYTVVNDGYIGGTAGDGDHKISKNISQIEDDERKVWPDADVKDNNVPFRESGIFQMDRFLSRAEAENGHPVSRYTTAMMRSMWTNVMNQSVPAQDKLGMIENASMLDIYTSGLGDLIIALPRYNQVPVLDQDSITAGPDFTLARVEDLNMNETSAVKAIDRGDLYHGREYVLSDFGLVSRSIYKTEDGKIDRVVAQATFDLFGGLVSEELAALLNRAASLGAEKFQAFFGDREMSVQQAFSLDDGGKVLGLRELTEEEKAAALEAAAQNNSGVLTGNGEAFVYEDEALNAKRTTKAIELLGRYAAAVRTKINIRSNTLDITYKIPRPIELGRTVFLPDNAWLYYVTRVSRSWRVGEDYTETYHGEYGHPSWFHVPIPWITLPNENEDKVSTTDPDSQGGQDLKGDIQAREEQAVQRADDQWRIVISRPDLEREINPLTGETEDF
jgi:hypothetical protein